MFPMPGNAFAQQKALERQKQQSEATAAAATGSDGQKAPVNKLAHENKSTESVVTTFEMFTGEKPSEPDQIVSRPRTPSKKASPAIKATTDQEKSTFAHKSAMPEPLFHQNPVVSLFSRLTSKKSNPKTNMSTPTPPKAPESSIVVKTTMDATSRPEPKAKVEDDAENDPAADRLRSASYSSQASVKSNPHADPLRAIQNAHDTRFAFGPATRISQKTITTPSSRYSDPSEHPESMRVRSGSMNPTRDGKYARSKNTEVIDQLRIPSVEGSILSGRSVNPHYWVGPDGRIYSGPLLQPLTYQAPSSRERSESEQKQLFADFNGKWNSSGSSIYSPTAYNVAGGGAWEQMQIRYPNTLPPFNGYPLHDGSSSSQYSERLSQAGVNHAGTELANETSNADNEATPRNNGDSKPSGQDATPTQGRKVSGSSRATNEGHEVDETKAQSEYLIDLGNDSGVFQAVEQPFPTPVLGGFVPSLSYPGTPNLEAIEQFIALQVANLEEKIDHGFFNLHQRIDESRSVAIDKILTAINDKYTLKEAELWDQHNEAVEMQKVLSEKIKELAEASKKDFEKIEKSCLHVEQNVRVDVSKAISSIRAVNDSLRSMTVNPSSGDATNQSEDPPKRSLRRQASAGIIERANQIISTPSGSPMKKQVKTRKLTPMPGAYDGLASQTPPKSAIKSQVPPMPDTVSTNEIGIATTKDTPKKSTRQAVKPVNVLDLEPIKKPPPGPSCYPPATRVPNGDESNLHRLYPVSKRAVMFQDQIDKQKTQDQMTDNDQNKLDHQHKFKSHIPKYNGGSNGIDDKKNTQEVDKSDSADATPLTSATGGLDLTNQSEQTDGTWTGGKWYERAYGNL